MKEFEKGISTSTCGRCNRAPAVFHRSYGGERLCKGCFTAGIEKQVQKTVSKYNMLRRDDRIAVAVSGGKDSLSLLYILHKIESDFPVAQMIAITVDEGISGYRNEALEIVQNACRNLGVEHKAISFRALFGISTDEAVHKILPVNGELTPCAYCGVLRRKALNIAARQAGATKLATGHNLDDEVQTMMLNLVHGDLFRGARVEPATVPSHEKFVPRIKPLVEIPENEIALYAYLTGVEFQTVRCPHSDFALRNDLRDFLNKMEIDHPGTKFTVFRTFEKIRPLLKSQISIGLRECAVCGEPSISDVCESCRMLEHLEALS